VPNTLHTPLMSGTNAIHGIVLLGGIIVLGLEGQHLSVFSKLLLVVAIAFGTINVVGGFLVTDRMLGMFKGGRAGGRRAAGQAEQAVGAEADGRVGGAASRNGGRA
jgi:H+-translocating NAD(P) transhydrogenase subunit alpha